MKPPLIPSRKNASDKHHRPASPMIMTSTISTISMRLQEYHLDLNIDGSSHGCQVVISKKATSIVEKGQKAPKKQIQDR